MTRSSCIRVCVVLFKDLLKHTPEDHPDHPYLLDAQRDIKRLAERINKGRRSAEEAERETRVIQEIEAHIEGVEHVRYFLLFTADICLFKCFPVLIMAFCAAI